MFLFKEVEHYDFAVLENCCICYHIYDETRKKFTKEKEVTGEDNFKNYLKSSEVISRSNYLDSTFLMLYAENKAKVIYTEESNILCFSF
ncbi:hypothetical protein Lalb_Chr05g0227531 [Lupinus albus]|uniref:Uncharacterized protein n=1 Tax=Lupinus albus TaxID=3870 RepID=A0A6A4QIX6_LUPAL|nr:hypothetical protein Lalb_Chr05g0227531 [Lupinus albus]